MFRFANPQYLWLLLIVPCLVAVLWLMAYRRRRSLARFGNPELLRQLMPDAAPWRIYLKYSMQIAALVCLIFALARPQVGSKLKEQTVEGVEMMLVVDVSNSMLAEDLEPTRLARTRYSIDRLLQSLDKEQSQPYIGMVAFAGEAQVLLPIMSEIRMARSAVHELSTTSVSVQGTHLREALSVAAYNFSERKDVGHAIILITDGDTHDDGALEVVRRAAERGINTFVIGIGTPDGKAVRVNGEMVRDEKGELVVMKLNEELLKEIAAVGGGAYVRALNSDFGLETIVDKIGQMQKGDMLALRFEEYDERFAGWLIAAIILLLVESLVLSHRNPLFRNIDIFER